MLNFRSWMARLRPGDLVLWYVEGEEALVDAQGRRFGAAEWGAALETLPELPLAARRDALLEKLRAFTGSAHLPPGLVVLLAELGE